MKKVLFVMMGFGIASLASLAGCSGMGGHSEGSACGGSGTDDCGSNLACQPIKGHGSVCCPAPPESSSNVSCHASN